ncbi:MAG: hypothetical protein ABI461_20705, partial [Polyangiaceae bacterium]
GQRLLASTALTFVGVLAFWAGIAIIGRAKAAGGILIVAGPLLPCVVVEGFSGLLTSGPPLAAGVVIALITLISSQFQR